MQRNIVFISNKKSKTMTKSVHKLHAIEVNSVDVTNTVVSNPPKHIKDKVYDLIKC
jgi:hypothetical protein